LELLEGDGDWMLGGLLGGGEKDIGVDDRSGWANGAGKGLGAVSETRKVRNGRINN